MTDIKIFGNAAFGSIRIHIDEAGDPWFVAKDVCQVLGIQNPSDTVHKGLEKDEIAAIEITDTSSNGVTQQRKVLTISEPGLYALVFQSRKPEAKAFSRWVRTEVLPALKGAVAPREPYSPKEISVMQTFEGTGLGRVRVHVDAAGEPWFVAKDILEALDYAETYKASDAFQKVPAKWIRVDPIHPNTERGNQDLLLVSEQGLYFFLGRSDKPKALPFQKWVAGEVLPSIRKTGKYETTPVLPQNYLSALKALVASLEREAAAQAEIGDLKNQLGDGKEWKAAKAVPWVKEYFVESRGFWSVFGKKLAAVSREMHVEVRRLETSDYPEGVGLYRTDVIDELRRRLEYDRNMLRKWRR